MRERINCLRKNPKSINRFMSLMVPVFVEVYAASVALPIRNKALAGLLKITSFAQEDQLQELLRFIPMAGFIGGILSSRDNPNLVTGALQLVELLLNKLPSIYHSALRRQGVMYEIEVIANDKLNSEKDKSEKPTEPTSPTSPARENVDSVGMDPVSNLARALRVEFSNDNSPSILNLGSRGPPNRLASYLAAGSAAAAAAAGTASPASIDRASHVDPQDAAIARARALQGIFSKLEEQNGAECYDDAKVALAEIRDMVEKISSSDSSKVDIENTLKKLANWFTREDSMSSFELLRSGLIEGLLKFITGESKEVPSSLRHKLVLEIFTITRAEVPGSPSALSSLVKRLQESLSRLEPFAVSSVVSSIGGDESRRSPISVLGRQVRLRLVTDEQEVSKVQPSIVVSIHAIASFQVLNDYLRPRIMSALSGKGESGSSRLSGVLAAFAAATGIPSSESRNDKSKKIEENKSDKEKDDDEDDDDVVEDDDVKNKGEGKSKSLNKTDENDENDDENDEQTSSIKGKGKEKESSAEVSDDDNDDDKDNELKAMEEFDDEDDEDFDEDDEGHDPFMGEFLDNDMDDFDDEILEDEMESEMMGEGRLGQEKTVNFDVTNNGKQIEAKTPEGTRITTSAAPAEASPSVKKTSNNDKKSSNSKLSKGSSYASALKSKPADWHLEFELNGQKVDLNSTIYGAIHRNESNTNAPVMRSLWNNVYTLKFKRLEGPPPNKKNKQPKSKIRAVTPELVNNDGWEQLPSSISKDSSHAPILQLLRVLHALCSNVQEVESLSNPSLATTQDVGIGEMTFVNNKLTAKLNRQLEESMLIASSCLPDWSIDLPTAFPFLFTFPTRYAFLQAQSWGTPRLITKWQMEASRTSDPRRIDPATSHLGRMQRQKVRISRDYLLESAIKVIELYGGPSTILEIEYFDEVGTGLGPTLEFYSLVSKEFARKSLKLWRGSNDSNESKYVYSTTGLFPSPMSEKESQTESGKHKLKLYKILGKFLAKGLLDSRIIDVSFNPIFMKLILGLKVPKSISTVKQVDPLVGNSIEQLEKLLKSLLPKNELAENINGLALDFTLPGDPEFELIENGANVDVSIDNVEEYIRLVIDAILVGGVEKQTKAFIEGFSKIFSIDDMKIFTPEELTSLFGNADEDWTIETLTEVMKADHGFNADSPALRRLVEVMSEFDKNVRRQFLQFITGSPKLPIGGKCLRFFTK